MEQLGQSRGCGVKVSASLDLAALERSVRDTVGEQRWQLWFQNNTRLDVEDGTIQIGVPNRFFKDWLEKHFQGLIRQAGRRVFGELLAVRFRIEPELFQTPPIPVEARPAERLPDGARPINDPRFHPAADGRSSRPPRYTLANFVVGAPNRVAFAAVQALLNRPQKAAPPIFLFGAIGHGKTHLLKAIEWELSQRQPRLRVLLVAAEEFTNQYIEASRQKQFASFRRRFRGVDVLLIDDVQFLASKPATQEEFFHTLNALEQRGARVVVACDRHPRKLTQISEALRSRFLGGISAKIDSANREMRRQMLQEKANARKLVLAGEILDYVADHLHHSISELEGALNSLEHYCATLETPMTLALAREALADFVHAPSKSHRLDELMRQCGELFGITHKSLKDRSRARVVAHPRMLFLYLARKHGSATYSELGDFVGGLNHSSVIAAEKKVGQMMAEDRDLLIAGQWWKAREAVQAFERELYVAGRFEARR